MNNYGEELAYWYLRLNGFFPITNFVFHSVRNENQNCYNADADVLAIRPPNAGEEIGKQQLKYDTKTNIVRNQEKLKYIFVYCEVKTGKYKVNDLFPKKRIEYVLKRFGLDARTQIKDTETFVGTKIFKKVLIANKCERDANNTAIFIKLNDAISFINDRFREYDEFKYPSRMFFNSSFIQLLIHQVHEGA